MRKRLKYISFIRCCYFSFVINLPTPKPRAQFTIRNGRGRFGIPGSDRKPLVLSTYSDAQEHLPYADDSNAVTPMSEENGAIIVPVYYTNMGKKNILNFNFDTRWKKKHLHSSTHCWHQIDDICHYQFNHCVRYFRIKTFIIYIASVSHIIHIARWFTRN